MDELTTIVAKTLGNPWDGEYYNSWPSGHPSEGERVAIFAFEVTSVDGDAEDIRTYHAAPVGLAKEGRIEPDHVEPQGLTVQWTGCGTGTVVEPAAQGELHCQVRPDSPSLFPDVSS